VWRHPSRRYGRRPVRRARAHRRALSRRPHARHRDAQDGRSHFPREADAPPPAAGRRGELPHAGGQRDGAAGALPRRDRRGRQAIHAVQHPRRRGQARGGDSGGVPGEPDQARAARAARRRSSRRTSPSPPTSRRASSARGQRSPPWRRRSPSAEARRGASSTAGRVVETTACLRNQNASSTPGDWGGRRERGAARTDGLQAAQLSWPRGPSCLSGNRSRPPPRSRGSSPK
jgi:hypothetical protein